MVGLDEAAVDLAAQHDLARPWRRASSIWRFTRCRLRSLITGPMTCVLVREDVADLELLRALARNFCRNLS